MDTIALRLIPDADLKQSLVDYCNAHRIEAAFMLSCVGSLRTAEIRYAGQPAATHLDGKLEILSLSGTLSFHGCHLHIAVSDSAGKVVGGHLMDGSLVYTTAELVLGILPDVVFKRELDDATGYRELSIARRKES